MDSVTTASHVGLIEHIKATLGSQAFVERHRLNETSFTRQRCLRFVVVVLFLLNQIKRSLQDELDEFFKVLSGAEIAERMVTKSAFSHARKKLKYEAFVELNQTQVAYFYEQGCVATWQGLRLLAIDGSMSELPNESAIAEHFGVWHPAAGGVCPKARLSQLFDVLNHITVDAVIAPKAQGERSLAAYHCRRLSQYDLVLLDRGYPAFWLFALIRSYNAHFCVRMSLREWKVVQAFVASGLDEQIVTLEPTYEAKQECLAWQLPLTPLTVRLLRIPLNPGQIEVLATSLLDTQAFPHALFKDLYQQRWPVEEDYKALKARLEVENWSGKSVLAVYQDFHAKVFTKNLTTLLAHPLQPLVQQHSAHRLHSYQVNMTHAFSKMKGTLLLLFQRLAAESILLAFWQLLRATIEPIRPGRSCPRLKKVKRKRFPFAYKSAA
jgi:hypothetical protein